MYYNKLTDAFRLSDFANCVCADVIIDDDIKKILNDNFAFGIHASCDNVIARTRSEVSLKTQPFHISAYRTEYEDNISTIFSFPGSDAIPRKVYRPFDAMLIMATGVGVIDDIDNEKHSKLGIQKPILEFVCSPRVTTIYKVTETSIDVPKVHFSFELKEPVFNPLVLWLLSIGIPANAIALSADEIYFEELYNQGAHGYVRQRRYCRDNI